MSRTCIAVSPGEAEEARALGFGRGKIALIPNGVTVPASVCPRPGRPFRLAHFSRFDPLQKNSLWLLELARALRAAGRLRDCRFVLVGDGPQRAVLQQALIDEGLDCADFTGFRSDPRIFLRDAGCYISTSRWEGLPLAVLEAQAEGLPCLLTDVVGNRDAVEDNVSGWLYPLDDVQAAVTRICRLMDDATLWRRMSEAAHARAARLFSVERMAARVAECYQTAVPPRAHAPKVTPSSPSGALVRPGPATRRRQAWEYFHCENTPTSHTIRNEVSLLSIALLSLSVLRASPANG